MAEVVLDRVSKRFGGFQAVDGVSVEIADGEFFTLLGPSGCGKTTTLRLLAGLEYADSGRVLIGGKDVSRVAPARRGIAMVFQNYALYPHMTVAENISYPLKIRKVAEADRRRKVDETAERLGLGRVLERMPAEISGGQQQRVAVARAMVQDPMVYLFDEPLSNLDARLRLESRRFLKSVLKESGGTAVYVTHDQSEAMALSDRVAVMKEGRIAQVSPPGDLYLRPASTFVAGFVGNLPMNLVEGRLEKGVFRAGGFSVETGAGPDGPATLGARPEDLSLQAVEREDSVRGRVVDVEPLGSEVVVTVEVAGIEFFVRVVEGRPPRTGHTACLAFPTDRVHLFGEDGRRLN